MKIKKYEDMNHLEMDVMKELGSIGTGNAATALSEVISRKIEMSIPDVSILDYNSAIKTMGDPEEIVAGVMVRMSGEVNGIMLYILKIDFINIVLERLLSESISDYDQLSSMEMSALVEIGNIIICSYISALSKLADVTISLSVPGIAVNMLGGILSVPMAELGYQTDKIMTIGGKFICDDKEVYSNLLLMPEMESLNNLLKKLGVSNG